MTPCDQTPKMISAHASLPGLPPELLQEILSYLENPSLLQLASTCKSLNSLSLLFFFKRNDIYFQPSKGYLIASHSPPETLSAVRIALCVKQLRSIDFYFGVHTLLQEVHDLYYLIKCLPSIEEVRVHLCHVDISLPSWRSPDTVIFDVNQWFKAFTSLLNMIIEKGCMELHVTGGYRVNALYSVPEAAELSMKDIAQWMQEGRKKSVKNKANFGGHLVPTQEPNVLPAVFTRSAQEEISLSGKVDKHKAQNFLQTMALKTPNPRSIMENFLRKLASHYRFTRSSKPKQPRTGEASGPSVQIAKVAGAGGPVRPMDEGPDHAASRLSNIRIHSKMLLQPTFFSWTLSTLTYASWTIRSLSIACPHIPTSTWSVLLRSLVLPNLEIFEIATNFFAFSNDPEFKDLQYFFTRHRTIQTLLLQGVEGLDTPPSIKEFILPDLSSVMAPPTWVMGFLQMQLSHPDALSNLKSIGILTDYHRYDAPFNYDLFDASLFDVANFSATGITLTLRFMCNQGIASWFEKHVALGTENSVLSRLTCVSHLVILNDFFVEIDMYAKVNLPCWLGLFPCLQTVALIHNAADQLSSLLDPAFLKSIALKCPNIKTVRVGQTVVDLQGLEIGN